MASMVSLPSIQEGFPDIDFREPPLPGSYPIVRVPLRKESIAAAPPSRAPRVQSRHSYTSASPYHYPSYHTSSSRHSRSHLPRVSGSDNHLRDDLTCSPPRSHSTQRGVYPGPTSSFTQPPLFSLQRVDPSAAPTPGNSKNSRQRQNSSFTATHSFDVLRSEPGTVSLEHIASSKTLQNRASTAPKSISPTGVANGSAPAFRVALPTLPGPISTRMEKIVLPSETTDNILDRRYASAGDVQSIDRQSPAISPEDPSESPSMVSFSMSDGSNVSKLTVDDSGRSYFQETAAGGIFRVDGRGKKHQCPQCPKRFNRPSSLRIHVNTHTGARPFQCPYPRCGREFNVNSNMRRHYRNHNIAATAEVHPPRHNSGRRPRGYPREHPGRSSRTVFHVSPGQSTPTAASLTDDDSDMEDDFDDGQDSGFDDEDVDEDAEQAEEAENTTDIASPHYKSVTWSLSPSPPSDHDRTRPYQNTESHIIAPPCSSPPHSPPSFPRVGQTYTPSSPAYVKACRDSTVSTTLRPAFR